MAYVVMAGSVSCIPSTCLPSWKDVNQVLLFYGLYSYGFDPCNYGLRSYGLKYSLPI